MPKVINAPTADEVVSNLLLRLNTLIGECDNPDELLRLTESVAKLVTSMRNNSQFGTPLTDEEKADKLEQEIFNNALRGEVIDE